MDCSSLGSSVHGILQARTLEWVAMPSSRGSSQPRNLTFVCCISFIGRWILTTVPPGKPLCIYYIPSNPPLVLIPFHPNSMEHLYLNCFYFLPTYFLLILPIIWFPAASKAAAAAAKSLQSCPTLGDPIDSSPPGSPDPGILQARTLEWVAISFSSAWKWKN